MMTSITRWVLAHKRPVTGAWIMVTLVGIATVWTTREVVRSTPPFTARRNATPVKSPTSTKQTGASSASKRCAAESLRLPVAST